MLNSPAPALATPRAILKTHRALPPRRHGTGRGAMSSWRVVGMTYLKYADLCATHVRNCLKEPAKTKAASASNMHARIIKWENGKRGAPEIVEKIAETPAA